ncbi:hypothetical protein KIW84_062175 [Lathyrus oleraceus]|uniref:Putative plant transposon protein domain-containing protein n=1 Tax=Pisum sativum TaxID=3888 RepID=A0A9D5A641_PEA|nr:hypothetical protein KIW84_062175 [Pisum sativum]
MDEPEGGPEVIYGGPCRNSPKGGQPGAPHSTMAPEAQLRPAQEIWADLPNQLCFDVLWFNLFIPSILKIGKNVMFCAEMAPKREVITKKQKTAKGTSRGQLRFDENMFLDALQEARFRKLVSPKIWVERRNAINEYLGRPINLEEGETDAYSKKMQRGSWNISRISQAIFERGRTVVKNVAEVPTNFKKEDMTTIAQVALTLMLYNIRPRSHTSTIPVESSYLLYYIIDGMEMDVARIIANEIKAIVWWMKDTFQGIAMQNQFTIEKRMQLTPVGITHGWDQNTSNHRAISYVQQSLYNLQLQNGGPPEGTFQSMNPKAFQTHITWLGDRPTFSEGITTKRAEHQEQNEDERSSEEEKGGGGSDEEQDEEGSPEEEDKQDNMEDE